MPARPSSVPDPCSPPCSLRWHTPDGTIVRSILGPSSTSRLRYLYSREPRLPYMTTPTHARSGVPVAKQKLSVSPLFSPPHPAPRPIAADTKPEPIYKIAPESSFWARGEGWDGGLSEGYLRSMPHSELCECKACRNVKHAAAAAAARGLDRGEGKGGTWNDDRTQAQADDVILDESQASVCVCVHVCV